MKTHSDKGKRTEQQFRKWLTTVGFPDAERVVRTGWRQGTDIHPDTGDVHASNGRLVFQVKSLEPPNRAERQVHTWVKETLTQAEAAGADFGFLVVRRPGTQPREWWVFTTNENLVTLMLAPTGWSVTTDGPGFPVRMMGQETVALLHANGYGLPDAETTAT